jgi:hypothetical protein
VNLDADVDIDVGDRDKVLNLIKHIPASMRNVTPIRKHSSGVYVTDIPYDPVYDMATIDYAEAEQRGYFKLDLLNVHVYNLIKDEEHLLRMMQEPDWSMLKKRSIVLELIHLGNQADSVSRMPEPIDSIPRLAMFLAAIRPAKRHLLGKSWKEINETVWDKDQTGYSFKKSHSLAYAMLVVVHMNLLKEQENKA